jgi:hypothetical protein
MVISETIGCTAGAGKSSTAPHCDRQRCIVWPGVGTGGEGARDATSNAMELRVLEGLDAGLAGREV